MRHPADETKIMYKIASFKITRGVTDSHERRSDQKGDMDAETFGATRQLMDGLGLDEDYI